jgi:diguanylate cyclase (GGDEF)-like protein
VALRRWQQLHVARAHLAARARYQAAALHTEILRMQHKVLEHDAQRRATERARAELEAVNHQLSRKIAEVQALENALRQQASRDELTGLFNRRHLNAVLPGMWALAQREQRPLAVVIVDLDHFKQINDRYGHLPGDRLLAAFGELLNANSRKSDVACRYGGEEFCLLMPRTDAVAARRKAQSLLRRWREQVFELGGKDVSGLTFSAGVADSQTVPDSVGLLLKAADETLLDAKRLGRNRVLLHGGPVHSDALLDPLRA